MFGRSTSELVVDDVIADEVEPGEEWVKWELLPDVLSLVEFCVDGVKGEYE